MEKKARLRDLLKWKEFVPEDVYAKRMATCLSCNRLIKATMQCKECGCFMFAKNKISHSDCPIGKFTKFDPESYIPPDSYFESNLGDKED
jgi:predicted Zn-ribbon and HTH transcriptional regulator